jgi:CRISPR/Cas system CSM-associated protein Csm3 (group 7 of RAMP superfamily)
MKLSHIHFYGTTTSPWHIGRRKFGDYLYTGKSLWGRSVRGAILWQFWRTYCRKSSLKEGENFSSKDCETCEISEKCPFNNLRGTDEGEYKDKPRLIVTNLKFGDVKTETIALISKEEKNLGVTKGKGPVSIEYIPPGADFDFEVILMGEGMDFKKDLIEAVKINIEFFGWGGFRNEGFGRGEIKSVEEKGFSEFEKEYIEPIAEKISKTMKMNGEAVFKIDTVLMINRKEEKGFYTSILENGFKERLINSINERYWQFYDENIYVPVERVSGKARSMRMEAWSRENKRGKTFIGIGNEIRIKLKEHENEHFKALAITKYGIGRYKNMGFGSMGI